MNNLKEFMKELSILSNKYGLKIDCGDDGVEVKEASRVLYVTSKGENETRIIDI